MTQKPSTPPRPKAAYLPYASSLDSALRVFATFYPEATPRPVVLGMHGWHGSGKVDHPDDVLRKPSQFFYVVPDMRGRADSAGRADANGLELQDAIDAIGAAAKHFPGAVDPAIVPRAVGGSGGGSNVLGMLGKFPDLFAAAASECGVSDFALWFANDRVGEFRDEMEGKSWISPPGTSPKTHPEAYLSRGGRTTAMNLMTPLRMYHGEEDRRVPVEQPRAYVAAARHHGRSHLIDITYYPNVGNQEHYGGLSEEENQKRGAAIENHIASHTTVPQLPGAGRLVVAGYLHTRKFSVVLGSVGQVALLEYDLARKKFDLRAPSCGRARLSIVGAEMRPIDCRPMSLEDFCSEIAVPHPASYPLD